MLRLLLLGLALITASCKKDIPDPPSVSNPNALLPYYTHYYITFFTTTTQLGQITVTLNGEVKTIVWALSYNPGSNTTDGINFTVPPGTYSYSATSPSGKTWSGTITMSGAKQCTTQLLD